MASNKTQQKTENAREPAFTAEQEHPLLSVRIDRMVDYENTKVKAIASANIAGAYAVHGIRVIDSQKGLFVQMPQNSYEKDGSRKYSDIFHPITTESRTELQNAVLAAYEQQLQEAETQGMDHEIPEAETADFGQSIQQ